MQHHQKKIYWALIFSEASHVFCCVLPTLFSVLSLMAGFGLMSALPPGLTAFHGLMHEWELPVIVVSGLILGLGWWLDIQSRRVDCHNTGCHHGPCGPQKKKAHVILKIATWLFIGNLIVYGVFHRGMGFFAPVQSDMVMTHHDHDGSAH